MQNRWFVLVLLLIIPKEIFGIGAKFTDCKEVFAVLELHYKREPEYANVKPELRQEYLNRRTRLGWTQGLAIQQNRQHNALHEILTAREKAFKRALAKNKHLPEQEQIKAAQAAQDRVFQSKIRILKGDLTEAAAKLVRSRAKKEIKALNAQIAQLEDTPENKDRLTYLKLKLSAHEFALKNPRKVMTDEDIQAAQKEERFLIHAAGEWPKETQFTPALVGALDEFAAARAILTHFRLAFFSSLHEQIPLTHQIGDVSREQIDQALSDSFDVLNSRTVGASAREWIAIHMAPKEGREDLPINEYNFAKAKELAESYVSDPTVPAVFREAIQENVRFFNDFELAPNWLFVSLIFSIRDARLKL